MDLPMYTVDSFTAQAFAGNPAGVCLIRHEQVTILLSFSGIISWFLNEFYWNNFCKWQNVKHMEMRVPHTGSNLNLWNSHDVTELFPL